MVSCFEMFRAGYFGDAVTTYYNVSYLAVWSLALSIAGFVAVARVRDYVQVP
jgi:capsular polysaccharide transport system permease protein